MSEYIWKKLDAASEHSDRPELLKKVLILYTGGTVGMKWTKQKGYQPANSYLESKIRSLPTFCDPEYRVDLEKDWVGYDSLLPIPLPCTFNRYRILYSVLEYSPLLDSSNISMEDWATIATDISSHYHQFNGFVILHGTDTMAYTSSALSFMFDNLGKTVILTGSQVPISELRNDARDNILGALILAGQHVIPEVCIYFHNKLFRGNRTIKMNSASLEAFNSPNLPALATVGIDISIDWDSIHRPVEMKKFSVNTELNCNVGILRIFPGITRNTIRSFLQPPMKGVILQTYGAGNIPDTKAHAYMFEELKAACEREVVIVNCTQCSSGLVTEMYAGGIHLREAGVVPGVDMTPEAALTKLSHLLASGLTHQEVKKNVSKNLRGELTQLDLFQKDFSLKYSDLLLAVAHALNISSSKEVAMLRHTVFPPLMCAAASTGEVHSLVALQEQGGDFNLPDYDGRTPLHLASSEGHLEVVKYLLEHGASLHVSDRFNRTPLDNAVQFGNHDVIKLLKQTGADPLVGETDAPVK